MRKNLLVVLHNLLYWRVAIVLFLIVMDILTMTFWDLLNLTKSQAEWWYFKSSAFMIMMWIIIAYSNLSARDEDERYALRVLTGAWIPYGINWMIKELFFDPTKKEPIDYFALGVGAVVVLIKLKFRKVILK